MAAAQRSRGPPSSDRLTHAAAQGEVPALGRLLLQEASEHADVAVLINGLRTAVRAHKRQLWSEQAAQLLENVRATVRSHRRGHERRLGRAPRAPDG